MSIQDREWYKESLDQKRKPGGDIGRTGKENLNTYRVVKCRKWRKELYIYTPGEIDSNGFPYKCHFCGAQNRLYDRNRSSGRVILIGVVIVVLLLITFFLLTFFKIIPLIS